MRVLKTYLGGMKGHEGLPIGALRNIKIYLEGIRDLKTYQEGYKGT